MQEFSSISVSSYEPATLADRLNEQSADGWTVVAIVPTGSTVTAFLSRDATDEPSAVAGMGSATSVAGRRSDEAAPSEPDTALASVERAGMGASSAAIEPIDEPGGWAVSPESASSESSGTTTAGGVSPSLPSRGTSASDAGASWSSDTAAGSTAGSAAEADTSAGGASSGGTGDAGASAASAPAGWYADPSSRYELRYWDGSQWTEHVSRAGQQFTDPPVA